MELDNEENMNNFCKQIFNNITSFNVTQVRHIRETPWKREYLRRYGYKENFFERPDTLPRIPEKHKKLKIGLDKLPEYQPYKAWSDKRKYFGQNDYIGKNYILLFFNLLVFYDLKIKAFL
ncbi:UNVERIFIED_CONTAM: mRpL51 [Trichonephila clavipes]